MKEIKVEKDVVLSDCYYYLKMMWNGIYNMLGSIDNLRSRETYNRADDLLLAKEILGRYTFYLERCIAIFKENKDYDIDTEIRKYNKACNEIIRNLINKERA